LEIIQQKIKVDREGKRIYGLPTTLKKKGRKSRKKKQYKNYDAKRKPNKKKPEEKK